MIPTLAVVGHPNKGKSSIVATLAENTQIQVSPVPGTTRSADTHSLSVDGQRLYNLIDTPGFQRAGQVHQWLHQHMSDASGRPDLVRAFLAQSMHNETFADEHTLLTPIMNGAGIIYVVDGSKPYGPEYELEMEILRWTGQPRMALINMIGATDFRAEWQAGLGQYFSIVREFDAHRASFKQRLSLLRAFAELEESWRDPLERAIVALQADREFKAQQASSVITQLVVTSLAAKVEKSVEAVADKSALQNELSQKLRDQIRTAEQRAQREVQRIYRHQHSAVDTQQLELVHADLFAQQSWQLFGLSREQLAVTGAASGAVAGGALDLMVGGTSFFMGSVLGGLAGSVSAWFGGPELAKVKILGSQLGGDTVSVGPISNRNFPWVLLGRACLHYALISESNHAVRNELIADFSRVSHFFDFLDTTERLRIERLFEQIRKGQDGARVHLQSAVLQLLTRDRLE